MPTYSYRCTECGNAFDIKQSFSDDTLTECPVCGGVLRKVFSPVGVTFNGGGFYRTDSRPTPKSEGGSGSSSSGSGSSGSGSSGSGSSGSGSSASGSSGSGSSASKPSTPSASSSGSSASGS
ncbi:zinc ribbon domain-containing protein [Curtobacterium sp. MCPF17_052]|nr:FmdB family zinc ribbon protein [Curtobacterium sp. MCPF17_052]WIB13515.1 zinc ribbon domain-containing protein [Curtobacterium sp. MCPF17_052]